MSGPFTCVDATPFIMILFHLKCSHSTLHSTVGKTDLTRLKQVWRNDKTRKELWSIGSVLFHRYPCVLHKLSQNPPPSVYLHWRATDVTSRFSVARSSSSTTQYSLEWKTPAGDKWGRIGASHSVFQILFSILISSVPIFQLKADFMQTPNLIEVLHFLVKFLKPLCFATMVATCYIDHDWEWLLLGCLCSRVFLLFHGAVKKGSKCMTSIQASRVYIFYRIPTKSHASTWELSVYTTKLLTAHEPQWASSWC